MKKMYASIVVILLLGLWFNVQSLAAVVVYLSEEMVMDYPCTKRHFALQDAVADSNEFYGYTKEPDYPPLEILESDVSDFGYMAVTPYYKVFFKGTTVKMVVQNAWITFELVEQELGKVNTAALMAEQNVLSVLNVFDSVDLSYTVDTSLLAETLTLRESKEIDRVIQKILWEGMNPVYEDGSILFLHEQKKVLKILPPFMKDAAGAVCEDVHYELIETETGYELHKVIDEKGLIWLEQAVYPVTVDPSIETFGDAWESSGLTPYGQYFKNLKEYVNPVNGHLTVTQTDLVIPGRGFNLHISRVYSTPAVFYGLAPYEYEAPPVDVGKGWQLDFPWIGAEYLHLFKGAMYKIAWDGDTFESHAGNLVLVNHGDSYTLTLADGMNYYFDSGGNITGIEDVHGNTIGFTYENGFLTVITDTVGRTVNVHYSNNKLWKIVYNGNEIEYGYSNGVLQWVEDFLDRKTNYCYNTGYTDWLLSEIKYPAGGYTTYAYNRYADNGYYQYYVTHQRVVDVTLVRHNVFCYTGSFGEIIRASVTSCNEFDQAKSLYTVEITNGLVQWITIADAENNEISKMCLEYNSEKEIIRKDVYSGGSQTISYSEYYQYDSWGNLIYVKDAFGHEVFYSYANTDNTGYFVDYNGDIVKEVTNAFIESSVPSDVHTVMVGTAERQGNGNMMEVYHGYTGPDLTESCRVYAPQTSWLTFSGTFNEYTGDTSFLVDLTGHTVVGDAVLQITGLPSSVTYQESHSYTPGYGTGCKNATWTFCGWSGKYFSTHYTYMCGRYPDITTYEGWASIGPFTHYPGTLGYQSYSMTPSCNQQAHTFTVTTNWKAYPVEVDYTIDTAPPKTITTNLENTIKRTACPISDGVHTLSFSESSSPQTEFSWELHVPVDTISDVFTTTYTYDQYGNVTSVTNPQGHTTTYEYSPDYHCAYVTSKTDIVSGQEITVSAAYDFYLGTITCKTCACGSVTDYEYDVLKRLTKIIHPFVMGEETRAEYEIVYDDIINTVTLYNENDEKIIQYYDGLNRMVKEEKYTDILWAITMYAYNYLDKPKQVTDPLSRIYHYEYDAVGRAVTFINTDQTYKTLQYDDLNGIVTVTDENQHTKEYEFDWTGNLTSVTEHNGSTYVTQYQYDELGNVTQMINAEQHVFTYEYNSFFGITKAVYPDGTEQHFSYDSVGNVTQRIDQNGTTITYAYDAVSRLTEINYQDTFVSFTYNPLGQKTSMVTPDVTNLYHYDERNRLKEVDYVIDNTSYVIQYAYDPVGNVTEITYPDTTTVQYTYFLKDLLESIEEVATFSYYTDGRLEQTLFSNGVTIDYRHDTRGRTQTIHAYTGTDLLDLLYTYDAAGNITHIQNNYLSTPGEWITSTESYTYDDLDRLLSASNGFGTILYEYDSTKRLSVDENGQITLYTYDYDLLLSAGATTYTYDQNGNIRTKSADHEWVYHYDNANRLTQVDKNGQMFAQYVYNGDGNRIKKVEWSDDVQGYETTIYIYSGINVVYEENDTGTAVYVYSPAGRIAKRTTINNETTTSYYVTDHLGSTRLITDETGTPLTSVTFYPFGTPDNYTGSAQPYLFTGKEQDATGLYYFNARYYDPETGRFITRDPYTFLPDDPRPPGTSETMKKWLINPQRFDRYSYAQNNPLRYTDPTGLSTLACCDPQCNYICENDNAHNSNPGGTEGSSQYSTSGSDDEEETEDTEETTEDTECDAECQRLKAQKECIKECMEDPYVKELVKTYKNAKRKDVLIGVGGVAGCLIVGIINPLLSVLCSSFVLTGPYVNNRMTLDIYEQEIKDLGCACVL